MSKWGWQNLTEEYFKRTKLVHDNVTFGNKLRALKKEWRAIRDLQIKETGLGRSSDGSVMLPNNGGKRTARCTIFVCEQNY
jgi:hypothetical protein